MRIRNTTLAILWPIIFVGSVALAAAGDRYFSNPTLNKDVVIQVNKAGVTTDAIKVSGTNGTVAIRGRVDGTTPAAGEVGESYLDTVNNSYSATQSLVVQTSRSLQPGVWVATASCFVFGSGGANWTAIYFTLNAPTGGTTNGLDYTPIPGGVLSGNVEAVPGLMMRLINSSGTTLVTTKFSGTRAAGTANVTCNVLYVRAG